MEIDTEIFSAGTDGKYIRSVSVASKHFDSTRQDVHQ